MKGIIAKAAARLVVSSRWSRLAVLGAFPSNGVGAEIGVHLGDYAEQILAIARPRKLYLIDPWAQLADEAYKDALYGSRLASPGEMERRYLSVQKKFSAHIKSGQVRTVRQFSAEAMDQMADGSLDFVYIDGNHSYEFVKRDLELSLLKVKSGGIIAGDDYTTAGWWKGGVKKAVDELGWRKEVRLLWIAGRQFVFHRV